MTDEEIAERQILLLASERYKFALGLNVNLDTKLGHGCQDALERLMEREWIRLIDVSVGADTQGQVVRVFLITKPAREWLKKTAS